MSSLPFAVPLRSSCAVLALASCLAACGGGGGGSSPDTGSSSAPVDGAAGAGGAASAPVVAASAPSSSASASSGAASGAADVGIADAVATARALGVSASVALSLPEMPAAVAQLARGNGRTFHVDAANGSDANDGLAASATGGSGPWKTLARVQQQTDLKGGDTVELACGSVWHETLRLPADGAAGTPIVVASPLAGCATPPAIDGSTAIAASAWSPYRGNLWKTSLATAPLRVGATTGAMVAAHYPLGTDVAADPGSPYLALAADSNGAVLTTGADLALPAGATIDTTTRVHLRTNAWLIEESQVAAFDGVHLTLAQAPTYTASKGWGYYLTGQLWMLRGAGQWFHDATTQTLYAWMPDSAAPSAAVSVTTLATGIDLQSRRHVVVDGVVVHDVGLGADLRSTTDVTLRNLRVEDTADAGIVAAGSVSDVVESSRVARTGGDAITGWGGALGPLLADATAFTVRNDVVRESGVLMQGETMTSLPRRSMAAIFLGDASTASGNVVVDAGYIGIRALVGGTVENNFVHGACSVQDDCGGIYTAAAYNRTQIRGNTVMHARGSLFGQPVGARATAAQGIYLDDYASDMTVENNTVIDTDFGLQLHNAARNVVRGNRLYGNRRGQLWMQEDQHRYVASGDMVGNVVDANEIAPVAPTAVGVLLSTIYGDTSAFGSFTANRYDDRASPLIVGVSTPAGNLAITFGAWQGSTGDGSTAPVDVTGSATSLDGHATYRVAGANLVVNAALATDAAGWGSWNATAPSGTMTRQACAPGTCLRYVAGGSAGVLSSPGFALTQGAWYRLTLDAQTAVANQTVPVVVRVGSGDYASVSDRSLAFAGGTAWSRHSIVFQATRTIAGAGARIDLDGIAPGQSIAIANVELVAITPDALAQNSGAIVNGAAASASVACPFSGGQAALCGELVDLATATPVTWPLNVAAHSTTLLYARAPTLVDSDGDGIPDDQDACPGSTPGAAVNAAGCELPLAARTGAASRNGAR